MPFQSIFQVPMLHSTYINGFSIASELDELAAIFVQWNSKNTLHKRAFEEFR